MTSRFVVVLLALVGLIAVSCAHDHPGKYEKGNPENGNMRLTFKDDGTVIAIQGKVGGSWSDGDLFGERPPSLGRKIARIDIYETDGSEDGLVKPGSKTQQNPHGVPTHEPLGGQGPPWSGHCHRWYQIGQNWYWSHC